MQNLLALRQQQAGAGHGLPADPSALSGLSVRNPAGSLFDNQGTGGVRSLLGTGGQQQQPDENDQLSLAQRLLAFSGGGGNQDRRDVSSLDALGLLAMAAPRADGNNPNRPGQDGRSDS